MNRNRETWGGPEERASFLRIQAVKKGERRMHGLGETQKKRAMRDTSCSRSKTQRRPSTSSTPTLGSESAAGNLSGGRMKIGLTGRKLVDRKTGTWQRGRQTPFKCQEKAVKPECGTRRKTKSPGRLFRTKIRTSAGSDEEKGTTPLILEYRRDENSRRRTRKRHLKNSHNLPGEESNEKPWPN